MAELYQPHSIPLIWGGYPATRAQNLNPSPLRHAKIKASAPQILNWNMKH